MTEFPLLSLHNYPSGIAAGPDGNLWFTEFGGNQIGRISPSGTITEFPVPTAIPTDNSSLSGDSGPLEITARPDGNLLFTKGSGKIGRITSGK